MTAAELAFVRELGLLVSCKAPVVGLSLGLGRGVFA